MSSSTVSPFMRRATMNPAIWAGVAAPSRISAIAARARSGVEVGTADESVPRTAGHPSKPSASVTGATRTPGGAGG